MARTPYSKTVWEDRNATDPQNVVPGTKLNAENMNKLENGLADTDQACIDLEARVLLIETSVPVGEQNADLTQVIADINADKLLIAALRDELDAAKLTIVTLTDGLGAANTYIDALQLALTELTNKFNAHVHSNEVGDTTGGVINP